MEWEPFLKALFNFDFFRGHRFDGENNDDFLPSWPTDSFTVTGSYIDTKILIKWSDFTYACKFMLNICFLLLSCVTALLCDFSASSGKHTPWWSRGAFLTHTHPDYQVFEAPDTGIENRTLWHAFHKPVHHRSEKKIYMPELTARIILCQLGLQTSYRLLEQIVLRKSVNQMSK